jgi:hypothetical protein
MPESVLGVEISPASLEVVVLLGIAAARWDREAENGLGVSQGDRCRNAMQLGQFLNERKTGIGL